MDRAADLAAQEAWLATRPDTPISAPDWGEMEPFRIILVSHGCHAVKAAKAGYYLVDGVKLSRIAMVCRARTLAKGKARWQRIKAGGL